MFDVLRKIVKIPPVLVEERVRVLKVVDCQLGAGGRSCLSGFEARACRKPPIDLQWLTLLRDGIRCIPCRKPTHGSINGDGNGKAMASCWSLYFVDDAPLNCLDFLWAHRGACSTQKPLAEAAPNVKQARFIHGQGYNNICWCGATNTNLEGGQSSCGAAISTDRENVVLA